MRAGVLVFAAVVAAASTARADAGEIALGPQLVGAYHPAEGRAGVALRIGATDWVALEARLGLGLRRGNALSQISGGVVVAWDVLAWVPELALTVGAQLDRHEIEPRMNAEVGFRRYFGPSSSLGFAGGGEWGPITGGAVTLRVTLWLSLN